MWFQVYSVSVGRLRSFSFWVMFFGIDSFFSQLLLFLQLNLVCHFWGIYFFFFLPLRLIPLFHRNLQVGIIRSICVFFLASILRVIFLDDHWSLLPMFNYNFFFAFDILYFLFAAISLCFKFIIGSRYFRLD